MISKPRTYTIRSSGRESSYGRKRISLRRWRACPCLGHGRNTARRLLRSRADLLGQSLLGNHPVSCRSGVETDTPVQKNGVRIGRVAKVELLEDKELIGSQEGGVKLRLELDSSVKIRQGEDCRIKAGSLITGDAIVEFIPATTQSLINRFDGITGTPRNNVLDPDEMQRAQSHLVDGDYLVGGINQPDPMTLIVDMQSNFAGTLSSIDSAARRIDGLAKTFQDVLGGSGDEIQGVVEKTKQTLDTFNQTAGTVQRVFGQVENSKLPEALAKLLEKMPRILDEAEGVVVQTKATLKSFEDVGKNFQEVGKTANETMKNVEEFTSPLRGEGSRTLQDALKTVNNLNELILDLRQLTQRVNNGQGTIARLIDDDSLYYSLVSTLDNIRRTTEQLQPIMKDARVLSDKLARDPGGQIGVRGILSGRPAGVGLK